MIHHSYMDDSLTTGGTFHARQVGGEKPKKQPIGPPALLAFGRRLPYLIKPKLF
jgi:hypothetical protein